MEAEHALVDQRTEPRFHRRLTTIVSADMSFITTLQTVARHVGAMQTASNMQGRAILFKKTTMLGLLGGNAQRKPEIQG